MAESTALDTATSLTNEALDYQLADYLMSLDSSGSDDNAILHPLIVALSRRTREGRIYLTLNDNTKKALQGNSSQIIGRAGDYTPLILDQDNLYLYRYWDYQQRLVEQIRSRVMLHESRGNPATETIREQLAAWRDNSETIDWQQIAIALALLQQFLIISGGPGTGKTTTIARILTLLNAQQTAENPEYALKIVLAAPTGKAAMRMQESIKDTHKRLKLPVLPAQASTLHRLLGYIAGKPPRHHAGNPLNADVVIIDEASMIDLSLMTRLIEAVPAHARLILLGDKNQLSSVETGSVFADMSMKSGGYSKAIAEKIHALTSTELKTIEKTTGLHDNIVVLKKSYRFSKDSGIGQLAQAVNAGQAEQAIHILRDTSLEDVSLVESELTVSQLVSQWQSYFDMLKAGADTRGMDDSVIKQLFTHFNHNRILSPLRKGKQGVENLNRIITHWVRQHTHQNAKSEWYQGRPVMILQNNYPLGLFNGDLGIVKNDHQGQMKVWFEVPDENGKTAYKGYSPARLPAHETAWAMTIHKSQGSEFNHVTIILPNEDVPLLSRELIYTGLTRAKQNFRLAAKPDLFSHAINRKSPSATCVRDKLTGK
jgi:exodeoxyribonuclease V alpha subunit